MSLILDWVAPELRSDALSDLRHPTAWLLNMFGGQRTAAGVNVSPEGALSISAYYAGLRAISEDLGKLPLITYEREKPRGKRRATDHPNFALLHDRPNPDMTAMTFRETLTHWALGWGNGYAQIRRQRGRSGNVVALEPIHPALVTIRRDENDAIVYDVRRRDDLPTEALQVGDIDRLRQDEVLHIKGLGSGVMGYSVAELAAESLGLTWATQQFGAEFFGNGSAVGDVLKHPGILTETALAHLEKSWRAKRAGNKLGTTILEEGMTWERVGIPPNDAQFLETRELQVDEIARWLRIPLHKIQKLKDATFSNIEQQSIEYVTDTLQPWLVRWEQEIKRKLFARPQDQDFFAEHLILGLLRGDQASRAAYYRERFFLGSLSPNDIRELENENPIADPAADLYYVQTSMAPLTQVASPPGPPAPSAPIIPNANGVAAHAEVDV